MKIVIGIPGFKGSVLAFTLDEQAIAKAPAEAAAEEIRASLRAQGTHWNKTGRLVNGITLRPAARGYDIVPPPDRLSRDPELLGRLREAAPVAAKPWGNANVKRAVHDVIANAVRAVKVER